MILEEIAPIINDKLITASFFTHEGYPCFWQDYYNWGLAKEGTPMEFTIKVQ